MFTQLIKYFALAIFVLALSSSGGWAEERNPIPEFRLVPKPTPLLIPAPVVTPSKCVSFNSFLRDHPLAKGGQPVWSGLNGDGTYMIMYHFDKNKTWILFTFHVNTQKVCFDMNGYNSKPRLHGLVI